MIGLAPHVAERFPHRVATTARTWEDQVDWCTENFGLYMEGWDYTGAHFYFRTEADKLLFILRWGSK